MLKHKTLIILICVIGLVGISYGILNENNPVFIIGILFVIAGYLLVRRHLKEHLRNDQ